MFFEYLHGKFRDYELSSTKAFQCVYVLGIVLQDNVFGVLSLRKLVPMVGKWDLQCNTVVRSCRLNINKPDNQSEN